METTDSAANDAADGKGAPRATCSPADLCDNGAVPGPNTLTIPVPPAAADAADDGACGGATPELFDRVYEQLHDLARRRMSHERPELTLQATALVHEVYLRLMKDPQVTWDSPRHFFGAAAEAMRRILIERARHYAAQKHGGGRRRVDLAEAAVVGIGDDDAAQEAESAAAMLELDAALGELRGHDAGVGEVVMLRYFAGLSVEETAAATGRSPRSVKRDWAFARAWLARRLDGHA